jgi:hypothetical protein
MHVLHHLWRRAGILPDHYDKRHCAPMAGAGQSQE